MSNARDVIIRPLVTEKTMGSQDGNNTVVFEVAKGTNKIQIRQAVEEIFNVKVEKVNIVNTADKAKRLGRYKGVAHGYRKAIVKLAEGYSIDLYDKE